MFQAVPGSAQVNSGGGEVVDLNSQIFETQPAAQEPVKRDKDNGPSSDLAQLEISMGSSSQAIKTEQACIKVQLRELSERMTENATDMGREHERYNSEKASMQIELDGLTATLEGFNQNSIASRSLYAQLAQQLSEANNSFGSKPQKQEGSQTQGYEINSTWVKVSIEWCGGALNNLIEWCGFTLEKLERSIGVTEESISEQRSRIQASLNELLCQMAEDATNIEREQNRYKAIKASMQILQDSHTAILESYCQNSREYHQLYAQLEQELKIVELYRE